MQGVNSTAILQTEDKCEVLVTEYTETDTYGIALRIGFKQEWKSISKELHDLLLKELAHKDGHRMG